MAQNSVTVIDRAQRVKESALKIQSPFQLDESLCLYSPQDNVDSLAHPRIADWIDFVSERYLPVLPEAKKRILLLMPCTKTKPYPFSGEHKSINQRLLETGFKPIERVDLPQELQAKLEKQYDTGVLNLSVLSNGKGTIIHRMVISEPMALVPYEHIAAYEGKPSPATAYDDPGLFENRGNAVSPWREDFSAEQVSATRWRWGDQEKLGYVAMHNAMAEILAKAIGRIGPLYTDRIAWVAPGLTHRSFVLGKAERASHNVPSFRRIDGRNHALIGANDHLPADLRIECLPSTADCKDAIIRLAARLNTDVSRVGGTYSRGGANATPLALPELLDTLVARLGQ